MERWLEQQRHNEQKRKREDEEEKARRAIELERWISFFRAVIELGGSPGVGLLLHFYRTGPGTERIKLSRRDTRPVAKLTADDLLTMQEDVLYEFRR